MLYRHRQLHIHTPTHSRTHAHTHTHITTHTQTTRIHTCADTNTIQTVLQTFFTQATFGSGLFCIVVLLPEVHRRKATARSLVSYLQSSKGDNALFLSQYNGVQQCLF